MGLITDQMKSGIEQGRGEATSQERGERRGGGGGSLCYLELHRHPALLIIQVKELQVKGGHEGALSKTQHTHQFLVFQPGPKVVFVLLRSERCRGNNSSKTFALQSFVFASTLITANL